MGRQKDLKVGFTGFSKANRFVPPVFVGIFGHNINYSLSPLIQNKLVEICIREGIYKTPFLCYGKFDVPPEKFSDAFNGFKALKLKGANITQPYKTEVIKYLDSLNGEAELIGAVNTANLEDNGVYMGYNTDAAGFIKSVKCELDIDIEGKKVIVLGAGGASRAVLYGLIKEGASKILIINRDIKKAEKLRNDIDIWNNRLKAGQSEVFYSDFNLLLGFEQEYFKTCNIIINCITPSSGSLELIKTLPLDSLNNNKLFAIDISYNNYKSTQFLELLNDRPRKCVNGLPMLFFQAIESFYIWTGERVDYAILRNELLR